MKTTIKHIALLSAAAIVLSAAACGKKEKAAEPAAQAPAVAPAAPAAPAATGETAGPAKTNSDQPETLMHPEKAAATAPETFKARFTTTKGDFVVEVHRSWAPKGADRFFNLVKIGYFDEAAFFRVIDGFMVQFGINGHPAVSAKWRDADIPDDPPAGQSNKRGFVTFATAGPNTRTTQLFINFADNSRLDASGFVPFGQVVSGMDVVDSLYKVGEGAPMGPGPDQGRIQAEGNIYLKASFPQLDYVKTAKVE